MRDYVGSVTSNQERSHRIPTPHGLIIADIDISGRLAECVALIEGRGLAVLGRTFLATSGKGGIATLDNGRPRVATGVHWDNEIARVNTIARCEIEIGIASATMHLPIVQCAPGFARFSGRCSHGHSWAKSHLSANISLE